MDENLKQYLTGRRIALHEVIGLPYPNEHSARLRAPDDFDPDSFRRTKGGTIFGKIKVPETVSVIWGKLKGKSDPDDPPLVQALRFPTKNWTAAKAKKWLKDNNIKYQKFEPATKKEGNAAMYRCECLKCGHKVTSEKHCRDLKCPKCGGQMRRVERPGPGQQKSAATAPIALSCRLTKGDFEIDAEAGTLKGVSIITRGPAKGHGFDIDDVSLEQVAEAINAKKNGIRSHLGHPIGLFRPNDGIETRLGRFQNAKIDKDKVRADFSFGPYATDVPGKGDVRTYLMHLVDEDPAEVALSALFTPDTLEEREDEEGRSLPPALRFKKLLAIDWVDDPAANPGGLLSGKHGPGDAVSPEKEDSLMDPKVKKYLESLGLKADASDKEALEFLDALTSAQKAAVAALQDEGGDESKDDEPKDDESKDDESKDDESKDDESKDDESKDDEGADESVQQQADKAVKAALARERKRREGVVTVAREYGMSDEEADKLAAETNVTPETAGNKVLAWLKKNRAPLTIHVGADQDRDTLGQAISDAICMRSGIPLYEEEERFNQHQMREVKTRLASATTEERFAAASGVAPRTLLKTRKPHERAQRMQGLPIRRMAAQYLRTIGIPGLDEMDDVRIVTLAMRPSELRDSFRVNPRIALAHSTSDFPLLLADVLGKSLRARYVEYPKTWPIWVRPTTNADFKEIKRIALSGVQDLTVRPEGAEVKYGTMSESRETYYLAEYARGFKCTRRMLINDDLDAFSRLPALHMDAAVRLEEDVVYLVLTTGAATAMADGVNLFNQVPPGNNVTPAGHWNLVNTALNTAGLDYGRERMRVQPGPSPANGQAGPVLNIEPTFLIVPARLEGNALRLLQSEYIPAATMGHAKNIWRGALTPVIQPRLDRDDPEDFYLAADYNRIDTVEICFLEAEQTPVLATETEFDTGDMKIAIRHTVAAKAIDYRGLLKSEGGESGESGSVAPSIPA